MSVLKKEKAPATTVIHSRISLACYQWLLCAAAADGRTVSSYVAHLLMKELLLHKGAE